MGESLVTREGQQETRRLDLLLEYPGVDMPEGRSLYHYSSGCWDPM